MDRTKSGVGVDKPSPVPDCSMSTWDPRACGGMGISPRERILEQQSSGHKISPSPEWGREGVSDLGCAGKGHRMESSRDQQGLKNRVPTEAELGRKQNNESHSEV